MGCWTSRLESTCLEPSVIYRLVPIQSGVWHPTCFAMKEKEYSKWPHFRSWRITIQTSCLDGMGWNQQWWMYGPSYYFEWYFEGPKICRQNTETLCHTLRSKHWRFIYFLTCKCKTTYSSSYGKHAWSWNNTVYGMASLLSWPEYNRECLGHVRTHCC